MRTAKQLLFMLFAALPMMAGSSGTVTIVYVPVAGTPTLSETALIALALLLPVLAFRSLRSMNGGRGIAALMVAGGLLALEAISGYHMLPTMKAIAPSVSLSNPAGGTVSNVVITSGNPQVATNTSGVRLLVQSVNWTAVSSGWQPTTGSGYCANGIFLNPAAACSLAINFVGGVPGL